MTKTLTHVEIAQYEAEARRLRAETLREMGKSFGAWFRGLFGGHAHAHRA